MLDRDDDLARRARKWVEETTLAQGLSVHVTDPAALRRIGTIFGWDELASDSRVLRSKRSPGSGHQA
jgi:hypothetical protein